MDNESFSRQKQQIVAVLIIVILSFLCYKLVIPYYKYSQFKIDVQKICNWDRENYLNPPATDVFRNLVYKAGKKRKLPIFKSNIKVKPYEAGKKVRISVIYKEPIDLLITKFDWEFSFKLNTEDIF